MKKFILVYLSAILLTLPSFSQNCNLALKDKGAVGLNIKTWSTPMVTDLKFGKLKQEKKDESVITFNAGVASGAIKTASDYPLTYKYTKTATTGGDEYKLTTTINNVDYSSYMVCHNDTQFIARNRGVMSVPDGKGGIYGYSIQGIQIIPMNLKVGDELPMFTDISVVLPTTTDMTVQKKILDHYSTSTSNGFGYAPDDKGNMVLGPTIETKTTAVFNTVDVAVKKTVSFSGHTLHFGKVTAEEEVTVNGTKYKAFVVEGETWTKNQMAVDFESADADINRMQKKSTEKILNKMDKVMVKHGFTNEDGYMVMFSRSWFVPTIGFVKIESYDIFGAISSLTTVTGVE